MSERLFRTMTDADRTGVADVGYSSWHANRHYQEWFDTAVESRVKAWLGTWVKDPKCDIVVCVVDDRVVGWGARDNYEAPGCGAVLDYISDLWISPDAQGRGMGSAILNALMERMRAEGLARARIEVAQANLRAIDLYVRQGFRETWRGVKMSETLGLPLPRILLEKSL
jgi:[ribosomal protein S18]-alanine N-acetyltransferase